MLKQEEMQKHERGDAQSESSNQSPQLHRRLWHLLGGMQGGALCGLVQGSAVTRPSPPCAELWWPSTNARSSRHLIVAGLSPISCVPPSSSPCQGGEHSLLTKIQVCQQKRMKYGAGSRGKKKKKEKKAGCGNTRRYISEKKSVLA